MRKCLSLCILACLSFCLTDIVFAEEDGFKQEAESSIRYLPSRSAKTLPGSVEIIKSEAEYSYNLKVFGRLPVTLSLGAEYIGINDSVEVELPSYLTGLTTDIETTLPFLGIDNTYFRLGIAPSFYGDSWDFETSSFRMPQRFFLIYKPKDQLIWVAGVAVFPDFDSQVAPIFGCIYKPNDRLIFNLIPQRPNIAYALTERITLFLEGGFSSGEYEVDKGQAKNVVLCYNEAHVGSGIKFRMNKFIETSLSVGGEFDRRLEYRDGPGKVNIENGFYSEFRLQMKI